MNSLPSRRTWRDPGELPAYLGDDLENMVHEFRMGHKAAGSFMAGLLSGMPDDPLLHRAGTSEDAIQDDSLRVLKRLSPSAADYYRAAQNCLKGLDSAPAATSILGHVLRELEGTIRDVWWDLACFADPDARSAREHGRQAGQRDASHKTQIDMLARRLSLTETDRETWRELAGELPGLAHRAPIGPSRRLTPSAQVLVHDALPLLVRIVRATEAAYGDALLRAAALLEQGPSTSGAKIMSRHLPHHPPFRQWLLAQIDDPAWLGPLHTGRILDDCEPASTDDAGSPIAPACPAARATARVASQVRDQSLLNELVTKWLAVDNPRLHTDVVQILIENPSDLYQGHIDAVAGWVGRTWTHASIVRLVGDNGVLRFPSHCLRLAARACDDGRSDLAKLLATASADGIAKYSPDRGSFDATAQLAIIGAAPKLNRTSTSLVKRAFKRATKEWDWPA